MDTDFDSSVEPTGRFQFGWVASVFFRSRRAFQTIAQQMGSVWLTPMLVLSFTMILRVWVTGWLEG
ncbi:MAG: hypothetical protein JW862_14035 [Anaerolineales bacterium]|nr:hypothetical protein [Anaerolineales bacterium]